ncbi:MAG: small-conductance mechanosensitive channel, partial [Myxococcota bacterium]
TEIGLRSVRLQTLDDSTISIPNNQFLKEAVSSSNAGALDMMVVLDFYLEPNAPFERAKQLVFEAVVTSKFAYLAKPVVVFVNETIVGNVFTTNIMAKAYVFNTKYEKPFVSDVTERVKVAFRESGIRSMSSAVDPHLGFGAAP